MESDSVDTLSEEEPEPTREELLALQQSYFDQLQRWCSADHNHDPWARHRCDTQMTYLTGKLRGVNNRLSRLV
jgi:hypothetical protein